MIVPVQESESEVQLIQKPRFEFPPVQGRKVSSAVIPPNGATNWVNGANNMINGTNRLVFTKEI